MNIVASVYDEPGKPFPNNTENMGPRPPMPG